MIRAAAGGGVADSSLIGFGWFQEGQHEYRARDGRGFGIHGTVCSEPRCPATGEGIGNGHDSIGRDHAIGAETQDLILGTARLSRRAIHHPLNAADATVGGVLEK